MALVIACASTALAGGVACDRPSRGAQDGPLVVTTVSPIADIVRNVAGDAANVVGVVPEGVDSHTFEPSADTARRIADAHLILVNGLGLDERVVDLARANAQKGVSIYALGDHAVDESEYVFDFSFPASGGEPNPHLWMSVPIAVEYADLTAEQLAEIDPATASVYRAQARGYVSQLEALDEAIRRAVETIPPSDRVLLTYHDSFAYFAREYGFRVIGAVQPSDFAEPSAREVADLIDQIEREDVPAIFGSEVFPSPVLEQIARETGVRYEDTLRDDDLPGTAGDPGHSYIGLMVFDVASIVEALGGDAAALRSLGGAP